MRTTALTQVAGLMTPAVVELWDVIPLSSEIWILLQ